MQAGIGYTIFFIIGAIMGAVMVWFIKGRENQRQPEQMRDTFQALASQALQSNAEQLSGRAKEQIEALFTGIRSDWNTQKAEMQNLIQPMGKSLDVLDQQVQQLEQRASNVLQANAEIFLKQSKEQLDNAFTRIQGDWNTQKAEMQNLVQPMGKSLEKLDQEIRQLEEKREGAYQGLSQQINEISKANRELQNTTNELVSTLKSPTSRGRWGEIQLRRVVELAGMTKHVGFEEQVSSESGRPDMTVNLPNGGILLVDAKAPMDAYLEAIAASNETERVQKLAAHANAVRGRIRELSQRSYWTQYEKSPELVIMFIPNEACLSAAFEQDGRLLDEAIEKKVLPASPVTLLALLQAVACGWQQQMMTENARSIINQGRELYQRIGTFIDHFRQVGRTLGSATNAYNKAVGSLSGRVIPAASRLHELGVGSNDLEAVEPIEHQVRELNAPRLEDGLDASGQTPNEPEES